jgi:hypothetical protein
MERCFWGIVFSSAKKEHVMTIKFGPGQYGKLLVFVLLFAAGSLSLGVPAGEMQSLEKALVVLGGVDVSPLERTAAEVLMEEVEKRSGLKWPLRTDHDESSDVILLSSGDGKLKAEGYRITSEEENGKARIRIAGADGRGLLYGVGKFLRMMEWEKGRIRFPSNVDLSSSPAYPIRGHQLGYRALSNTYDAWTPEIYEQYIRELALFGTNSIEFIPYSGTVKAPLKKVEAHVMLRRLSEICRKYDMDYWIQTGASFDLGNLERKSKDLARYKVLFESHDKLDALFFPGGDPGENHPKLVLPYLEEIAELLKGTHPDTKIWMSLQTFDEEEVDFFFEYINHNMPAWFGGIVSGPASPPIPDSRKRLPKQYRLRHYPDITHSTRGQYPVSWWDPALGRTLGRECPNPQPVYYGQIHNWFAPYTDGFISYSDGVNDDVNKFIWSALGWDPDVALREVLEEYGRLFFRPDLAGRVADGILALEKNWVGPLAQNGSVETTLYFWQALAKEAPELDANWRWQLCQIRSKYDAYIRRRVIHERGLEEQVNSMLGKAPEIDADAAMKRSLNILNRATTEPVSTKLREEIQKLGEALFNSIGMQLSVEKYHGYGYERGVILDYLDLPMNNRLWLEDEFEKIGALPDEGEKLAALEIIRTWEDPGEGSFYDDLGTLDRSEHLVRGEDLNTDPCMERNPNPGFWIWEDGFNRLRLSWLVSMDNPIAVVYEDIDIDASYDVRCTGYRVDKIQINGDWVSPFEHSDEKGAIIQYHVPAQVVKSGKITLTWGDTEMTEVWLIKK